MVDVSVFLCLRWDSNIKSNIDIPHKRSRSKKKKKLLFLWWNFMCFANGRVYEWFNNFVVAPCYHCFLQLRLLPNENKNFLFCFFVFIFLIELLLCSPKNDCECECAIFERNKKRPLFCVYACIQQCFGKIKK